MASSSRILLLSIHSSMDLTATAAMTCLDGLPSFQQQPKPTTTAANQHDATPNYLCQSANQIHNKNSALSIHSSMDSTGKTTMATTSLDGRPSLHGWPKQTATAANQHNTTLNYLCQCDNRIHNKNTALSIHSSMDLTGTTTASTTSLDGRPSLN